MYTYNPIYIIVILLFILVKFTDSRQFRIAWMVPNNIYHGLNASSSVGGLKLALQSITHPTSTLLVNHTVK